MRYICCPFLRITSPFYKTASCAKKTNCVGYLRLGISQSGRYKLYDQPGKTYAAYCDMKSELDTTWTMVMSRTLVNGRLSAFFKIPFKYNSPQNEDALN